MLSISAIKNSQEAMDYFGPAEYYQPNELDAQTAWFGHGAAALGLTGDVDMSQFKELLDGNVAGSQLGRVRDGEREHQPGWDLTFSAPKSLSILTTIGGDKRLIEAHQAAVKTALGVLEQELTKTRVRVSREQVVEAATGSLVVAQFVHSLSRENDPQLHTHCVVANATQRSDGQWRSLQSVHFYDNKMLVGQIYRNELALLVQKMGYQLDIDHRTGLFEIKGIPQTVLESFSKRRQEIESVAKSPDARDMERATLFTRKNKRKESSVELMTRWVSECKQCLFDQLQIKQLINQSISQTLEVASEPVCGKRSVEQAIDHLSKKEAVFISRQLSEAALKLGLGEVNYAATSAAVQQQKESQSIVPSSLAVRGRVATAYTTPNAVSREQYILKLLKQGKAAKGKLSHRWKVDEHLKDSNLSQGQKEAIKLIMTNKDQFLGIQGYAGVGKTTMLRCAKPLIEAAGYQLRACAPTHAAVDALKAETGINSRTLASFLLAMEKKQSNGKALDCSKEVWVIDEASLIGAKDMANLLTCARATKSRVVLLGDKSQLGAVSWGKPFHLMMQNGMNCAVMKEIQRQKVEQLKIAVEASIKANSHSISWPFIGKNPTSLLKQQIQAARNDIGQSLAALSTDVVEISAKKNRRQEVVNYYAGLNVKERENCLVIIPDNRTRHELMSSLREVALKDLPAGVFKNSPQQGSLNTTILCEIDCPNTAHAQCYGVGEVVEFSKTYKKMGIRPGDRFYVTEVNGKTNTVSLAPFEGHGKVLEWNPEKVAGKTRQAVTLLQEYERSLVVGEKIVFNKPDKKLGFKNGDVAVVTAIDSKNSEVTAKLVSGKKVTFNCQRFRQFDHGYATTAYKAQGKTVNQVVILAESYRENLITQKSFYVALSRARFHAKIFTDDKIKLMNGLGDRPGHKTSSLEQEQMLSAINRILEKNTQQIKQRIPNIQIAAGPECGEVSERDRTSGSTPSYTGRQNTPKLETASSQKYVTSHTVVERSNANLFVALDKPTNHSPKKDESKQVLVPIISEH